VLEFRRVHDVVQADERHVVVGHFDADEAPAGHRRFNADRARGQGQRQVRVQPGNRPHLDARLLAGAIDQVIGLHAELRDHRAGIDLHDLPRRAETTQRILDHARLVEQDLVVDVLLGALAQNPPEVRHLEMHLFGGGGLPWRRGRFAGRGGSLPGAGSRCADARANRCRGRLYFGGRHFGRLRRSRIGQRAGWRRGRSRRLGFLIARPLLRDRRALVGPHRVDLAVLVVASGLGDAGGDGLALILLFESGRGGVASRDGLVLGSRLGGLWRPHHRRRHAPLAQRAGPRHANQRPPGWFLVFILVGQRRPGVSRRARMIHLIIIVVLASAPGNRPGSGSGGSLDQPHPQRRHHRWRGPVGRRGVFVVAFGVLVAHPDRTQPGQPWPHQRRHRRQRRHGRLALVPILWGGLGALVFLVAIVVIQRCREGRHAPLAGIGASQ